MGIRGVGESAELEEDGDVSREPGNWRLREAPELCDD